MGAFAVSPEFFWRTSRSKQVKNIVSSNSAAYLEIINRLDELSDRLREVESGLAAIGGLVAQNALDKHQIDLDCYLPMPGAASDSGKEVAEKLVLIVEDDPSSQLIYRHIFQNLGYGIVAVPDGREAVEVYQTLKPDLVLMDLGLPTLDGYQTSREIRSLEFSKCLKKAPILCVTASCGDEEELMARKCGMDEFIAKPIDIDSFQAAVAKWCVQ